MKKITFLLLFFVLCMSACTTSLVVLSSGVLRDASRQYIMRNGLREIIYLPLHHMGTREYYDKIRNDVDSLQKEGYVVYYESIAYNLDSDSLREEYDKKFRKLTGDRLGQQQCIEIYRDTVPVLRAPMYQKLGNRIIPQPNYSFFTVDYTKAVNADLPKNKLLDDFEYKYGEVKLNACDLKTKMAEPYRCKPIKSKLKRIFDKEFIMEAREHNLASLIDDAPMQKILILFGGSHFKGFSSYLQQRDPKWVIVKK